MTNRVVVTGVGNITPLGLNAATTWTNLCAGKNGVGPLTAFDATGFSTRIAAQVRDFNPLDFLDRKRARRTDRFVHFALVSAHEAMNDARLLIENEDANRVGVIMGSAVGGMVVLTEQFEVLRTKGPDRISPFLPPMMILNMAAGELAIEFGVRGPNYGVSSACASGANAIGEAFETIRRGAADVMIAGGTEAAIVPLGLGGFAAMRALSTRNDDPEHASRPFDRDRDGFVMGEGAGVLILESMQHAMLRHAPVYCEIAGYGSTADASHITDPAADGSGLGNAITIALNEAGLRPEDVTYINAHGTGTAANDPVETMAIKRALGEHAYRVAVSSTKSMTGHLMGATGAVEAIFCCQVLLNGVIPPTINLEHPDPACDLDYVPNEARMMHVRAALSNSMGFGGHNAVLAFRQFTA